MNLVQRSLRRAIARALRSHTSSSLVEAVEQRRLFAGGTNVVSYHNDLASTGQNLTETQLTPSTVNVSQFQKQFTTPVDGQVYAQPLYVSGVQITSGSQQGLRSVAYVATEHDSLYAIDSNGGNILWRTPFLDTAVPLVNKLGAATINTVPQADTGSSDLTPEVGITSTPVIDLPHGLMYVLAKTKQTLSGSSTPHYVQTLFEVNIQSGAIVRSTVLGDTAYSGGAYTYRTANTGTGVDPYVVGTGSGAITVSGQSPHLLQRDARVQPLGPRAEQRQSLHRALPRTATTDRITAC